MSVRERGGSMVLPPILLAVLDADFTCNQPREGGEAAYERCFVSFIATTLGAHDSEFERHWGECVAQVAREVGVHGFIYDLKAGIAAAAESDLMMRLHAIAWLYARRFAGYDEGNHRVFRGHAYDAHRAAYPELGMAPVPDFLPFLRGCRELGVVVAVVTNSAAVHVCEALMSGLGEGNRTLLPSIRGGAAKFDIYADDAEGPPWTPSEEGLPVPFPPFLHIGSLRYPVPTRRPKYFDALQASRRDAARGTSKIVPLTQTIVAGDNTQLDLALPDALGMRITLVENENTPCWDKAWMRESRHVARRHPIHRLTDLLTVIRASHGRTS